MTLDDVFNLAREYAKGKRPELSRERLEKFVYYGATSPEQYMEMMEKLEEILAGEGKHE